MGPLSYFWNKSVFLNHPSGQYRVQKYRSTFFNTVTGGTFSKMVPMHQYRGTFQKHSVFLVFCYHLLI